MRILLLHPEDSPLLGPWSQQRWDLVVDLGKSSLYSEKLWSENLQCPVLRSDCFRRGIADAKQVRQILSAGQGRLIDDEGIDWWYLISLLWVSEVLQLLALERVAAEIPDSVELWATRSGWAASALARLLHRPLLTFENGRIAGFATGIGRYARLVRRFSPSKIKEIILDKYDAGYQWRARLATRPKPCSNPVVLLPSAYENVSRMAADYARLLPQQSFLMVTTRQSGRQFNRPANVRVRDLADYATADAPKTEVLSLIPQWQKLRGDLCSSPELRVLSELGVFDSFPSFLRDGLFAREVWREVIEREPVCGVLCGDDSNWFTSLPVLLAAPRKIPTVDFHHGAFDGNYLFKKLPCDVYMAKNEMERDYLVRVCDLTSEKIAIAAPMAADMSAHSQDPLLQTALVYFSEPYEVAGMRSEAVYRELLPGLLRVARENGRTLTVKLHPFESRIERKRLIRSILGPDSAGSVTVLDGPLTVDLLARTWCGITVESTTVLDCQRNGFCCFLCGWLRLSSFEYVQQFARFGVGEMLHRLEEIGEIPKRLADFHSRAASTSVVQTAADPRMLERWLTSPLHEFSAVRSAS
jgi:hypothetical protein